MDHELVRIEPAPTAEAGGATLCQLAEAFMVSLDVALSSRMTYRRALKAFFDWISATGRADRIERLNRVDTAANRCYAKNS